MLHVQYIKCKGCLFFFSNICRICFRCKWNDFDAIIVKTTQKMNFLPLYHTLLRNMIHFVLSIENQNYTKKQGTLIGYRTKCYENVIPQDGEIFVTEDEKVGIYIVETKQKRRNSIPDFWRKKINNFLQDLLKLCRTGVIWYFEPHGKLNPGSIYL